MPVADLCALGDDPQIAGRASSIAPAIHTPSITVGLHRGPIRESELSDARSTNQAVERSSRTGGGILQFLLIYYPFSRVIIGNFAWGRQAAQGARKRLSE